LGSWRRRFGKWRRERKSKFPHPIEGRAADWPGPGLQELGGSFARERVTAAMPCGRRAVEKHARASAPGALPRLHRVPPSQIGKTRDGSVANLLCGNGVDAKLKIQPESQIQDRVPGAACAVASRAFSRYGEGICFVVRILRFTGLDVGHRRTAKDQIAWIVRVCAGLRTEFADRKEFVFYDRSSAALDGCEDTESKEDRKQNLNAPLRKR
jgi:hypothetical protein